MPNNKKSKLTPKNVASDEMMVPVYLNYTRKNLIMSLNVKCGNNKTILTKRGLPSFFGPIDISYRKFTIKFIAVRSMHHEY